MNWLAAALLPAAALGGCASLTERAPAPDLGPLLSFTNPPLCEPSPTLTAFLEGLTRGDADAGFSRGVIVAPRELLAHIGRIDVKKTLNYWVVRVPVRGSWLGLPVVAVHQTFPKGGDPGAFQLELEAPVLEAERRLRRAGFPAKANVDVALGEPEAYDHVMTLTTVPGRSSRSIFGCGYS